MKSILLALKKITLGLPSLSDAIDFTLFEESVLPTDKKYSSSFIN